MSTASSSRSCWRSPPFPLVHLWGREAGWLAGWPSSLSAFDLPPGAHATHCQICSPLPRPDALLPAGDRVGRAPQHRHDRLRRSRLARLRVYGPPAHQDSGTRPAGGGVVDLSPRVYSDPPLLAQPDVDHHGSLSARASHHQQRSARAAWRQAGQLARGPGLSGPVGRDAAAQPADAGTAPAAAVARVSQFPDRQMVDGELPERRLHPRHEPRRQIPWGPSRRRGTGDRAPGHGSHLRFHRRGASAAAPVSGLVCPVASAQSAHCAVAIDRQVPGGRAQPGARALLGERRVV